MKTPRGSAHYTTHHNRAAHITPSGVVEGTLMFKRDGTYYLQWSEGNTRNVTYQVAYAKAQSPAANGGRAAVTAA
jgi:beta-xylosidase